MPATVIALLIALYIAAPIGFYPWCLSLIALTTALVILTRWAAASRPARPLHEHAAGRSSLANANGDYWPARDEWRRARP